MNQKFVQDTEQENSWWPNIGIPGSEEYMLCVKVSGPEQAERVPWTESIPKYYLTHSHVQCRLMAWSRVPWSWKVLRTQYCLCTYTHRQQVQRGFYPRACVWGTSSLYCGSEDRTQKAHVEWLAWSQALNQLKNRSILQFSISNTFRSQSGQQKYVTERA